MPTRERALTADASLLPGNFARRSHVSWRWPGTPCHFAVLFGGGDSSAAGRFWRGENYSDNAISSARRGAESPLCCKRTFLFTRPAAPPQKPFFEAHKTPPDFTFLLRHHSFHILPQLPLAQHFLCCVSGRSHYVETGQIVSLCRLAGTATNAKPSRVHVFQHVS